jgi:16S rRNA (guanine527-N7)-methyltransferase
MAGDQDPRRERLLRGAAELGVALTPAQADQLMGYLALLQRWNQVYNLTAVRNPDEMLVQHLLDCLAVWPPLQRQLAAMAVAGPSGAADPAAAELQVLDVGSGGGLPGVVLAILAPAWTITCVDAVAKKATFIKQVATELKLNRLRGVHTRVEALRQPGGFHLITSRAFASLADFVQLTRPLLAPAGVWMAMKGKDPADERAALPAGVEVFHVEQLQVPGLDAERCLVWMRLAA